MFYPSLLTDEQIRVWPRSWIEPFDPSDATHRANPRENLDLRIKGDPIHGLTPYYTDFGALKRYYKKLYGPHTRAGEPESSMNDDWFVDMGADGIPRAIVELHYQRLVMPDWRRIETRIRTLLREGEIDR